MALYEEESGGEGESGPHVVEQRGLSGGAIVIVLLAILVIMAALTFSG